MGGPDSMRSNDGLAPKPHNAIQISTTACATDDDLRDLGMLELLDRDTRPILIVDLDTIPKTTPAYYNASYRDLEVTWHHGSGYSTPEALENNPQHTSFIEWGFLPGADNEPYPDIRWGLQWTAQTLRGRWRVISGQVADQRRTFVHRQGSIQTPTADFSSIGRVDEAAVSDALSLQKDSGQSISEPVLVEDSDILGPFDMTALGTKMRLSEHVKFILDFDWASTELGPISSWPIELRRSCNFLLSDPRPAALYYGPQRTMLYNEKYVEITGLKHPYMMGKPLCIAWAEVIHDFGPLFDKIYETGIAKTDEDALVYINRDGYLEETYFSLSIIPLTTSTGNPAFYNTAFETSRQVIADRRITFLLHLGQSIASAREPKDFWIQLLKGLQDNHRDVPFAILYSAGGDTNETLSMSSEQSQNLEVWSLEGCVRVPESCAHLPERLNRDKSPENFLPNFQQLLKHGTPTLLSVGDGSFPANILEELQNQEAEIGDTALFCPIRPTGDNVLGFLILGVNPRKRYDEDYKLFIQLLNRQLETSLATAVLFEDEIKSGQLAAEMAALDRNHLSKQLAIQTHEAIAFETRFRKMADLAPVGMFHIDTLGVLIYANENYYKLTQHPADVRIPFSWYDVLADIDHPIMDVKWHKLLDGISVSFEIRLKTTFLAPSYVNGKQVEGNTWILAAAYPEKDENGEVTGILGCLTDISRQKWAEDVQAQKRDEALELKRQQESFIDMTSHEMRNPLSAIVQCADFIATSLAEFSIESETSSIIPKDIIDSHIDAAQTIMHCGQHQKRIIDDILILSKINSHLLTVTPVDVQPLDVIKNALRMFDGELHKNDMELRFKVEQSFLDTKIEWLQLDPSRLLQVLINLTSNAIKFTQPEKERKINIRLGASLEAPTSREDLIYLPRDPDRKDLSVGPEWGSGEILYLHIEVKDTGRGLDEHERKLLFQRFSQASPRTHVVYGGSGLGLFISKELTELQGGQIGVHSEAGVGSTFAFYIRTRRGTPTDPSMLPSLPINIKRPIQTAEEAVPVQKWKGAPPQQVKPGSPTLPRHILVVEDNIVNQKVLSKQLRSAGCVVYVANHGKEALDFLEGSEFWRNTTEGKELPNFVCLMDLEMPVMDGLTCVKKIREFQQDGTIVKHLPVIAVTANARSEQITVAKEAGMDSVVTKPFRIPELIPEMDRILLKTSI